jgi:hypothetical protein
MAQVNVAAAQGVSDVASYASFFQGANGEDVYSNTKALYGYMPASKFFYLTSGAIAAIDDVAVIPNLPRPNIVDLGKKDSVSASLGTTGDIYRNEKPYIPFDAHFEMIKLMLVNFLVLRAAQVNAANAFVIAAFRARWFNLGCFITDATVRNSIFVETVQLTDAHATYGAYNAAVDMNDLIAINRVAAGEFFSEFNSTTHGSKWIIKTAEAMWAIVEYNFRTRGHHFKPEFKAMDEKILKSNFEGNFDWPAGIDYDSVFHTAIHPFGVVALPIMARHFAIHGKLGNAILIRFNAAPNGVAVITTTMAAVNAMRSETWFKAFSTSYKDQLELLSAFCDAIIDNKFQFHLAASVYGTTRTGTATVGGKVYTVDEMITRATAMAGLAQGFISGLQEVKDAKIIPEFSLENAKALMKHSASNPLVSLKMKILVSRTLELIQESDTMKALTANTLPMLEDHIAADNT